LAEQRCANKQPVRQRSAALFEKAGSAVPLIQLCQTVSCLCHDQASVSYSRGASRCSCGWLAVITQITENVWPTGSRMYAMTNT